MSQPRTTEPTPRRSINRRPAPVRQRCGEARTQRIGEVGLDMAGEAGIADLAEHAVDRLLGDAFEEIVDVELEQPAGAGMALR